MAKRKHPQRRPTSKPRVSSREGEEKTFGSGLDEIGFQPLGRRVVIERSRTRGVEVPLKHPLLSGAYYDRSSGRIVVEFSNGCAFMVPARSLQGLVDASEGEIAEVAVLGETGLHWERLDVDHEIAILMSGIFGTPNFMAGSAATVAEWQSSAQETPVAKWAGPVIEFLSDNLPGNRYVGWEHYYMTAYEVGCQALVALGQADEISGGAKPRSSPVLPDVPPRWDDISTAVIYVATQNDLLQYRRFKSRVRSSKADYRDDRKSVPVPTPNIAAANGVGPAYATSEAYSVLQALGLVHEGCWTKAAETILWRDAPTEWNLDFTNDARFIKAAFLASTDVPDDIRSLLDEIITVTEVAGAQELSVKHAEELNSGLPPDAKVPPKTTEEIRNMVERLRCYDLNYLFYRRWRLSDGWLSSEETKCALQIFHDPLAVAMRKAVMSWLYPTMLDLAR